MIITRHIRYIDYGDRAHRQELRFDPPYDLGAVMGRVEYLYNDVHMGDGRLEVVENRTVAPIASKSEVLHIQEMMTYKEVLSIEVQPKHRLDKIILDEEHGLQIYATDNALMYWITAGKHGILAITARVVEDKKDYLSKLKADLTDTEMRAYLVRRSKGVIVDMEQRDPAHNLLTHSEAAAYLRKSESWLRLQVDLRQINRSPNYMYLRSELDAYLRKFPDRRRKKGRK